VLCGLPSGRMMRASHSCGLLQRSSGSLTERTTATAITARIPKGDRNIHIGTGCVRNSMNYFLLLIPKIDGLNAQYASNPNVTTVTTK
jgi:hypothetical protein